MVVSVDISGVLEEKLRRLVELGIYASVSEAVRDAIRRLLDDLDLRRIALNLYTSKKVSLHYACTFASTPCPAFIEYMLLNGVTPLLGGKPSSLDPGKTYILDPSSLYVINHSLLLNTIARLDEFQILIPRVLENLSLLYQASYARVHGRIPRIFKTALKHPGRTRLRVNSDTLLSREEIETLATVLDSGYVLVTDDIRVREVAEANGIMTVASISFLEYAGEKGLVTRPEYWEVVMSLRGIPYFTI